MKYMTSKIPPEHPIKGQNYETKALAYRDERGRVLGSAVHHRLRDAEIRCDKYETELFRRGAMLDAPCFVCGYNGEGYFNPDKHECAKKHHAFFHNDDGGESDMKTPSEVFDASDAHLLRVFQCKTCGRTANGVESAPPRCHRRPMVVFDPPDRDGFGSLDHIHW